MKTAKVNKIGKIGDGSCEESRIEERSCEEWRKQR
jgi:hypothetical protein